MWMGLAVLLAPFSASAFSLLAFSALVSGWYFASNLRSLAAAVHNIKLAKLNQRKRNNTPIRSGTLTLVLVEGLRELVELRRHLESLHKDTFLSLDAHVARPLDEACQVTLRLDVSTKTEVANLLLEERSRTSSSATSTSFRLNDLLSLSFLHLQRHNESSGQINDRRARVSESLACLFSVGLSNLLTFPRYLP